MKQRTVSLVFALILVFGAAGCTQPPVNTETQKPQTESIPPTATDTVAPDTADELDVTACDEALREQIVETLNNGAMATHYNRILDSQAELDSVAFYDFYFIEKNQELNDHSNFVVRYTVKYDELDGETSMVSWRYKLSQDMLNDVLINYSQYADTLPDLLDYLYENQDSIEENGYNLSISMGAGNDQEKEGNFLSYDAETFAYYMSQESS